MLRLTGRVYARRCEEVSVMSAGGIAGEREWERVSEKEEKGRKEEGPLFVSAFPTLVDRIGREGKYSR